MQTLTIDDRGSRYDVGLTWTRYLHRPRCNLTDMLSWARSSARMSVARPPRGLRGFARVELVVAWVVFWLNTALFPFCGVAAAVLGGYTDNGSRSASAAPQLHPSDATHSEPLDHSPDSPCGYTLNSRPPLVGEYEVLTPDRSPDRSPWSGSQSMRLLPQVLQQ
jgi:hypothetical protein